jgi:putative membrane protein
MVITMTTELMPWLALAEGDWNEGAGLLTHLGTWGPWVLALAAVLLVARAISRQSRYRAVEVLDAVACERVHDSIRRAELRTVGEIVPVVVERSDPHPGACWLAALTTLLLGSALASPVLPFHEPVWLLLCQAGLAGAGWLLARLLPDVQRLFIRQSRADAVVAEQSMLEFHRLGLQRTEAATGVLLFVSLLEHRVVVLGDEGIDAHMGPERWTEVTRAVLEQVAAGKLEAGLVAAIDALGHELEEHFPWAEGDRNELPDRLEIRRE